MVNDYEYEQDKKNITYAIRLTFISLILVFITIILVMYIGWDLQDQNNRHQDNKLLGLYLIHQESINNLETEVYRTDKITLCEEEIEIRLYNNEFRNKCCIPKEEVEDYEQFDIILDDLMCVEGKGQIDTTLIGNINVSMCRDITKYKTYKQC